MPSQKGNSRASPLALDRLAVDIGGELDFYGSPTRARVRPGSRRVSARASRRTSFVAGRAGRRSPGLASPQRRRGSRQAQTRVRGPRARRGSGPAAVRRRPGAGGRGHAERVNSDDRFRTPKRRSLRPRRAMRRSCCRGGQRRPRRRPRRRSGGRLGRRGGRSTGRPIEAQIGPSGLHSAPPLGKRPPRSNTFATTARVPGGGRSLPRWRRASRGE